MTANNSTGAGGINPNHEYTPASCPGCAAARETEIKLRVAIERANELGRVVWQVRQLLRGDHRRSAASEALRMLAEVGT